MHIYNNIGFYSAQVKIPYSLKEPVDVYQISFSSGSLKNLREAGALFRKIVGIIPQLRYSPLGRKGPYLEDSSSDLTSRCREARRFKDQKGLKAFVEYLAMVAANTEKSDGHKGATVKVWLDDKGDIETLFYEAGEGDAKITLYKTRQLGSWRIYGHVTCCGSAALAMFRILRVQNGLWAAILGGDKSAFFFLLSV